MLWIVLASVNTSYDTAATIKPWTAMDEADVQQLGKLTGREVAWDVARFSLVRLRCQGVSRGAELLHRLGQVC